MFISQRHLVGKLGLCASLATGLLLGACGDGEGSPSEPPAGASGGGAGEMGSAGGGTNAVPSGDALTDTGPESSGPSAGCGLASSVGGGFTLDVEGRAGQYIVILPPNYDPTRSYP